MAVCLPYTLGVGRNEASHATLPHARETQAIQILITIDYLMKIRHLLLTILLCLCSTALWAQQDLGLPMRGSLIDGKTIVKLSPYHLADSGFGVEIERLSNQHISYSLGAYYLRRLPASRFALISTPGLYYSRVSSLIVEPSLRYYFNQGFGRGLYALVSLHYIRHQGRDFAIYLEPWDKVRLEQEQSQTRAYHPGPPANQYLYALRFEGTTQGIGGTLGVGYQILMGKRRNIVLDVNVGLRGDLVYSSYKGAIDESKLGNEPNKDRGLTDDERRELTLGVSHYAKKSFLLPSPIFDPKITFGSDNRSMSFTAFGYRWSPNISFAIGFRF